MDQELICVLNIGETCAYIYKLNGKKHKQYERHMRKCGR